MVADEADPRLKLLHFDVELAPPPPSGTRRRAMSTQHGAPVATSSAAFVPDGQAM